MVLDSMMAGRDLILGGMMAELVSRQALDALRRLRQKLTPLNE